MGESSKKLTNIAHSGMNECVSVIRFFEHQQFTVYVGKRGVDHIYFRVPGNGYMFVQINEYEQT